MATSDFDEVLASPTPMTVWVNGVDEAGQPRRAAEAIVVGRVIMENLQQVYRIVGPFMPQLKAMVKDSERTKPLDGVQFFFDNTDSCMALIAALQSKPVEWVKKLEVDSCIELFIALLMENMAFFIQRVLPSLSRATVHLSAVKSVFSPPVGPTSSSNSSPKDTATPTS